MDLLSDQYQPEGTEARKAYEAVRREEERFEEKSVSTKGLSGVVIILDPGHGGRDQGTAVAEKGAVRG